MDGEIKNLTALQGELAENPLVGAVQMHWQGAGSIPDKTHQGSLTLTTNNIAPSESNLVYESNAELAYTPDGLNIQSLHLALNELRLAMTGSFNASGLTIPKLTLHHQEDEWLAGSIQVPLTEAESSADRFWNANAPVAIDLRSIDIPLQIWPPQRAKRTRN